MRLLLDLPDELIVHVLTACAEERDLRDRLGPSAPGRINAFNFALTCKKAYRLAQSIIFSSILIRRSSQLTTLRDLFRKLDRRSYVKELAIVPLPAEVGDPMPYVEDLVTNLPQLEHLVIEIPWDQGLAAAGEDGRTPWERLFDGFNEVTISRIQHRKLLLWSMRLVTCHLNFQSPNGDARELEDVINVLAAPRLRELALVNADLRKAKINTSFIRRRSSPLKSLSIHSCMVSAASWLEVLAYPQAIKAVSFFPHYKTFDWEDTSNLNLWDLLRSLAVALAPHRHSLTHLEATTHGLESIVREDDMRTIFGPFTLLSSLTSLKLNQSCRTSRGLFNLLDYMSPSLTHLHISEEIENSVDYTFVDFAKEVLRRYVLHNAVEAGRSRGFRGPFLPKLKSLTCEFRPWDPHHLSVDFRSEITDIGLNFLRHPKPHDPIKFRVLRRTAQRYAVPPYLWDEYVPERLLWFDNQQLARTDELWGSLTDYEKEEERMRVERIRIAREEREKNQRLERERIEKNEAARRRARAAEWKKYESGIIGDEVEDDTWYAVKDMFSSGYDSLEVGDESDFEEATAKKDTGIALGISLDEDGNDRMIVGQVNSA